MSSKSLAGTWGSDMKKKMPNAIADDVYLRNTTTCREQYSDSHIILEKERAANKFAMFKKMQDRNDTILKYTEVQNTFASEGSLCSSTSLMLDDDGNMLNNTKDLANKMNMMKTTAIMAKTSNGKVAIGRSGARVDKGVATSGLLGERLNNGNDVSRNSIVQRSWLYNDDPALGYKLNGKPEAFMPNDVSLPIGEDPSNIVQPGWVHGRMAVLTGDPLSKAGAQRAGIFMDENLPKPRVYN